MIELRTWLTRKEIQENRDKIYIFGDNLVARGYGGQAKEARGEPNTLGIPTKETPWSPIDTIEKHRRFVAVFDHCMGTLDNYVKNGYTVVLPKAGLGTGLANLQKHSPVSSLLLCEAFDIWFKDIYKGNVPEELKDWLSLHDTA